MTIHEALERHLKALTLLKVYADGAPENSPIPYVTYSNYSTNYSHSLGDDTGYCDGYFQIDIYNKNKKDTLAIAKIIRQSLFNFNGEMGGYDDIVGVTIQATLLENQKDSFENQTEVFRVMQEYKFTYFEEV